VPVMALTIHTTCSVCKFGIVDRLGALHKPARVCSQCGEYFHADCLTGSACRTCPVETSDAADDAAALSMELWNAAVAITTNELSYQHDQFGGFERRFTWNPPNRNGFIVQRIDRTERVLDGAENEIGNLSLHETYWEAWPVAEGVVMFPNGTDPMTGSAHDTWARMAKPNERAGKHGDWAVTGTVYWLGPHAPELFGFVENAVESAAGLLATDADPGIRVAAVLTHAKTEVWEARTAESARDTLQADSDSGVMLASDRDEAIRELKGYGYPDDVATDGVNLYIKDGGVFVTVSDDDNPEDEDTV
jgi:hypothetical protein